MIHEIDEIQIELVAHVSHNASFSSNQENYQLKEKYKTLMPHADHEDAIQKILPRRNDEGEFSSGISIWIIPCHFIIFFSNAWGAQ